MNNEYTEKIKVIVLGKPKKVLKYKIYPRYEGDEILYSIHYDRRAVREANKNGFQIYKLSGEWNGYTYTTEDRFVPRSQFKKIKKILKEIDYRNRSRIPARILTPKEKIEKWAKRLDKLTGCGLELAKEIANEKINYEWEKLEEAMERGHEVSNRNFWGKKPAWAKYAEKKYYEAIDDASILLKRIEDAEHAEAILAAHRRHSNAGYDAALDEAKMLAATGEINREEIQTKAREILKETS